MLDFCKPDWNDWIHWIQTLSVYLKNNYRIWHRIYSQNNHWKMLKQFQCHISQVAWGSSSKKLILFFSKYLMVSWADTFLLFVPADHFFQLIVYYQIVIFHRFSLFKEKNLYITPICIFISVSYDNNDKISNKYIVDLNTV